MKTLKGKGNGYTIVYLSLAIFLLSSTVISAQGKESDPAPDECYKGIFVSYSSYLYDKNTGEWVYTLKFTNKYTKAVKFSYSWIVGSNKPFTGATYMIEPGKSHSDNMNLVKSPGVLSYLIKEVCFGGMNCGNDCYAICDSENRQGQPNQPCGFQLTQSENEILSPVDRTSGNKRLKTMEKDKISIKLN